MVHISRSVRRSVCGQQQRTQWLYGTQHWLGNTSCTDTATAAAAATAATSPPSSNTRIMNPTALAKGLIGAVPRVKAEALLHSPDPHHTVARDTEALPYHKGAEVGAFKHAAAAFMGATMKTHILGTRSFDQPQRFYASGAGPDFRVGASVDTTDVPTVASAKRRTEPSAAANRTFTYLMVGATGVASAVAGKNVLFRLLDSFTPAKDIMAGGSLEVDLTSIPLGKNAVLTWRSKPIIIRHRTAKEIRKAESQDLGALRDPQTDADRTQRPEWLVMLGICTHLGCVPIGDAGNYDAWYCPCHGSHYDISGRIRKGPAPYNLEIPPYKFMDDTTVLIGDD